MQATSHVPPELHNKMIHKYGRCQVGSVLWNLVTVSSKGSCNSYNYCCYLRWGSRGKESTDSLKHILYVAAESMNLDWRLLSNNVSAAHHSSCCFILDCYDFSPTSIFNVFVAMAKQLQL